MKVTNPANLARMGGTAAVSARSAVVPPSQAASRLEQVRQHIMASAMSSVRGMKDAGGAPRQAPGTGATSASLQAQEVKSASPARSAATQSLRQLLQDLLEQLQGGALGGNTAADGPEGLREASGGQGGMARAQQGAGEATDSPGGPQQGRGLMRDMNVVGQQPAALTGAPGGGDASSGGGDGSIDSLVQALMQALQTLRSQDAQDQDIGAEGLQGTGGTQASGGQDLEALIAQLLQALDAQQAGGTSPVAGDTPRDSSIGGTGDQNPGVAIAQLLAALGSHGQDGALSGTDAVPSLSGSQQVGSSNTRTVENAAAPDAGTTGTADAPASGATGAGLGTNPGGITQAAAANGVSAASDKVIDTGSGTDKTENVTNDTSHDESFTYSDSEGHKATMTEKPGETESFRSGSQALGVRISPSDTAGNTKPNEVLYEDGADLQDPNKQDPDISNVDGDKDFAGNAVNMTDTLGDGRTAGNGDVIRAYQNPTDDAAAMGLAGDTSRTDNLVVSDKVS